jgi:hypothetical protein
LARWARSAGDETAAGVARLLNTPFPDVRKTPILLLFRMSKEAARLARAHL